MINVRCSLCDDWLPILQISNLCPTCYKCRTIVKAYSADTILRKLQEHFLVDTNDNNNNNNDEVPSESDEASEVASSITIEPIKEIIKEVADDTKDYDKKPKTRNNHKRVIEELKNKM